jgi:hypothetical protein
VVHPAASLGLGVGFRHMCIFLSFFFFFFFFFFFLALLAGPTSEGYHWWVAMAWSSMHLEKKI